MLAAGYFSLQPAEVYLVDQEIYSATKPQAKGYLQMSQVAIEEPD